MRCLGEPFDDRVLGAALWASMKGLFGRGALRTPRTLAAVRALRRAPSIRDKAAALRRTLFGDRPYLCAHVRRVENAQRCPDGGSARAPLVSCPPVNAGYVATRRLAETLRKAAAVAGVSYCVEIKLLRRVRAESSRRPPRHRRDACSTAWRCRFLTARLSQHGHVIVEK